MSALAQSLICTFSPSSVWGRPLCPAMPKRKVTFQGVGNEDEEDETSAPKKVRRPDSWVLGRKRNWKPEAGKRLGEKERASFFMFSEKWVWRIFSCCVQILAHFEVQSGAKE